MVIYIKNSTRVCYLAQSIRYGHQKNCRKCVGDEMHLANALFVTHFV